MHQFVSIFLPNPHNPGLLGIPPYINTLYYATRYIQISHLETVHNASLRCMVGRRCGPTRPSTTEQLREANQEPHAELLSSHRERWLRHAARRTTTASQASASQAWSSSNCSRTPSRYAPLHVEVEVAMQDMRTWAPSSTLAQDREGWKGVISWCRW